MTITHVAKDLLSGGRGASSVGTLSGMWSAPNKRDFHGLILAGNYVEAIRHCQRAAVIFRSRDAQTFQGQSTLERLIHLVGTPDIREPECTDPSQVYDGLSVDLLYQWAIWSRLKDVLGKPGVSILEIGAGLGTLCRLCMTLNPSARYLIVDIRDTLAASYTYLKTVGVTVNTCASETDIEDRPGVSLLPADRSDGLKSRTFDIAINSHSFGEMTQEAVNGYMALIEATCDRVYSLNRYLQPDSVAGHRDSSYQAYLSLPLGANWETEWSYVPGFVAATAYSSLDTETTTEIFARRANFSDADRAEMSAEHFRAASEEPFRGEKYHRHMWDSVRLDPTKDNVWELFSVLKESGLREHRYYADVLKGMRVEATTLPLARPLKRTPRTMVSSILSRAARMIAPTT